MDKFVKVIGGTYPPTREFTEDELVKLKREYLDDCSKTLSLLTKHGISNAGELEILFDKLLSPFQYWLENYCKCEILNKKREELEKIPKEERTIGQI